MVKLIDILREVAAEQNIKIPPGKEAEVAQAKELLASLENLGEGALDEGKIEDIGRKLKKLGLSVALLTALAGPSITTAQQTAINFAKEPTAVTATVGKWQGSKDIKKIQNLMKAYRLYTIAKWKNDKVYIINQDKKYSQLSDEEKESIESRYMKVVPETGEDGRNGEYTSQFTFPGSFLEDLNNGTITNLGIEGNAALKIVNQVGLTTDQMKDWNSFVKWMKGKGYAGKSDMNKEGFSKKVFDEYKKEVPGFWVQW
jgi:hypothetical protein